MSGRGGASPRARRAFIETWGCQMNELDSQRMAGQLMQQGVLPTRDPADADIILLNSCSVRDKAEQKVYSRLGEYRLLKQERRDLLIGLCGCVAQQEGERALARVPDLDFVIGPARVGELQEVVAAARAGRRVARTGFPERRPYDIDAVSRHGEYKGMVTIVEGCNKRCTFCIVPQTRGPERSRPLAEIVAEVEHLIDYGFLEIELLGQTVNHWREPAMPAPAMPAIPAMPAMVAMPAMPVMHAMAAKVAMPGIPPMPAEAAALPESSAAGGGAPAAGLDFSHLLDRVARLPGLRRLRFVTSYPRDFTPAMVEQVGKHPNICPYLHLPVQSGSDRVLRRMGRGYTRAEYLDLVGQLRRARPGLAVSTDMIVGFPGETEEDFQASVELVREVRFTTVYAFLFSPRPGTAAPRLDGGVEHEVAAERLQRLFAVQDGIQRELNRELIGQRHEVLVTGWGKQPGTQTGRTACHRIVHFPVDREPVPMGQITSVRIESALPHSLLGRRVA